MGGLEGLKAFMMNGSYCKELFCIGSDQKIKNTLPCVLERLNIVVGVAYVYWFLVVPAFCRAKMIM